MISYLDEGHPAAYYTQTIDEKVKCGLCFRHCTLLPGDLGSCRVRINESGTLKTLNYGKVTSLSVDPIEKKPLYHFFPGSHILSAGTLGCNLTCSFCQNWQISQEEAPFRKMSPDELAALAVDLADKHDDGGNLGIAFTYSEPVVWYEFVLQTAKLLRGQGLKTVLVTNGMIEEEPLTELLPYIDAMNIDVKAFTDRFYKEICGGSLETVKRAVQLAHNQTHLEITTLVIPGENDTAEEIGSIAEWLASLSPDIPLHLSRYFPQYKMTSPSTPIETMLSVWDSAKQYLQYVYIGNLDVPGGSDTFCPKCGALVIDRGHQKVDVRGLKKAACSFCGESVSIVM